MPSDRRSTEPRDDDNPTDDWQTAYWDNLSRRAARAEIFDDEHQPAPRHQINVKSDLELDADRLMANLTARETQLRREGVSPHEIASYLTREFGWTHGFKVTGEEIASGKVWWRVADILNIESGSQIRWTESRLETLKALLAANGGRLSYAKIARRLSIEYERDITAFQVQNVVRQHGLDTGARRREVEIAPGEHQAAWTRRMNLDAALMAIAGLTFEVIAERINRTHKRNLTAKKVERQLFELRITRSRRSTSGGVKASDKVRAIVAASIAERHSYPKIAAALMRETGRVFTRGAVAGQIRQIRMQRAMSDLASDLGVEIEDLSSDGIPTHVVSRAKKEFFRQ